MIDSDGISGTDNVEVLFPDRPSAAPAPVQPEVVAALEAFVLEAAAGKCTGVIIIGFDQFGGHRNATAGQVTLAGAVTTIEQLKFSILARDFAANNLPK